jgi:hypothetical protein
MRWVKGTKHDPTNDNRLSNSVPASYTVWKDDSSYYAESNIPGGIDYNGTSFSTVLQNAIDALDITYGGKVFIKEGRYYVDAAIVLGNDDGKTSLIGENPATTELCLSAGVDDSMIKINPTNLTNFIYIDNLSLWGSKASQAGTSNGIEVNGYAGDIFINRVYIDDFYTSAIWMKGSTLLWNVWITNCLLEGCSWEAINLDASVACRYFHIAHNYMHDNLNGIHIIGNSISNVNIHDNIIKKNDEHGVLFEAAQNIIMTGNQINDNSNSSSGNYDGVYLGASGGTETTEVTIASNIIGNKEGATQRYGVNIADTSDYITLTHNNLLNNATDGLAIAGGANANGVVRHNPGYVTENGGVTGAIATGTAVNHGLSVTPGSVTVTAAESGPTDIYVDTVGAASFKINFGGGGNKTFYWVAEYKP